MSKNQSQRIGRKPTSSWRFCVHWQHSLMTTRDGHSLADYLQQKKPSSTNTYITNTARTQLHSFKTTSSLVQQSQQSDYWSGNRNTQMLRRPFTCPCPLECHAGWPQSRRKNSRSFPGFFQSHKYTSPEVIAIKLKVSRPLRLDKVVSNYIIDDISQQNFTQSTAVLRKYAILENR